MSTEQVRELIGSAGPLVVGVVVATAIISLALVMLANPDYEDQGPGWLAWFARRVLVMAAVLGVVALVVANASL